jgi:hypothetical protein
MRRWRIALRTGVDSFFLYSPEYQNQPRGVEDWLATFCAVFKTQALIEVRVVGPKGQSIGGWFAESMVDNSGIVHRLL